jgi:hypothetical protein
MAQNSAARHFHEVSPNNLLNVFYAPFWLYQEVGRVTHFFNRT